MIVRSTDFRRVRLAPLSCLFAGLSGCPAADDGSAATDATTADTTAGADTTTTGFVPSSGPLGCAAGESCTFVLVAQAFDDRLEIFAPVSSGPVYRGAIDLDLKPNPMGDNSGELLDEPYGMVLDDAGLMVLVGHYPRRDRGTAVVFSHELLGMAEVGATIPRTEFFDGAAFTGVTAADLAAEEAIFAIAHPSGRQLIGVFANDLFAAETDWTNPGELLVFDPSTGDLGRLSLAAIPGATGGCAGAWSLVALDDDVGHVALACDGDEGAVILDTSGVGQGSVADAAAAITGCVADIPFVDKRVRNLAPDGSGGILVAENTPLATLEDGRLWRFDSTCTPMGAPGTIPGALWEARQIVALPTETPHWLMATGLTAGRGIHVVRDGAAGPELCATLDELDPWWTATDGSDVHPYALALDRAGRHLAVGAAPPEAATDAPGYGRLLWIELGEGDPCAPGFVGAAVDLVDEAPAVDVADPATWRRAPNVVLVREYG